MSECTYFTFDWPHNEAKTVYVTGTFDNWSKSTRLHKKRNGDGYTITIEMPNVKSFFKFVVDGEWVTNPVFQIEQDSDGFENNVVYPEQLITQCAVGLGSPGYKSESDSSAFTTVSLSELCEGKDDDVDDGDYDSEGMAASTQDTLTRNSFIGEDTGDRETRYYTSMSFLSRFTRYFK